MATLADGGSSRALRSAALEAASPSRRHGLSSLSLARSVSYGSTDDEATKDPEPEPSYLVAFVTLPCQLCRFVSSLYADFDGFVPAAVVNAGVNMGAGSNVANLAQQYLYKDVLGLAGDPALMANLTTAGRLPWTIKPVMGMLSDTFPLFGFHLTSYMGLGAAAGILGFVGVGALPLTAVATVPFFILFNFSTSVPDVVLDAAAAKLSKDVPERASDLQSLIFGSLPIGIMAGAAVSATLLPTVGPKLIFLFIAVCPLSVLVVAVLRWLPEERLPPERRRFDPSIFDEHGPVVALAFCMSAVAITLAVLQILIKSVYVRSLAILISGATLAASTYFSLRPISSILAKTALFIFLNPALQPDFSEGAMQAWLTNAEDGPHFSKRVMACRQGISAVGLLAGAVLYNKYLTTVPYRHIFLGGQLALAAASFLDLILVSRWNLSLGMPDVAFILGDDAIACLVGRSFMMPLYVLSSKVCPDNLEATLFATLMALCNLGFTVGTNSGAALTDLLGITHGNYDMLPHAVVIRSFCRLLPIPLIFLLIPNLAPQDPIPGGVGSVYRSTQFDKDP